MNCKVCENTSAKNTKKVSFFRFPKEKSRCKDWADRCNLQHLYEKYDSLRFYKSFRICSDHFDPKDIIFDGRKKRLLETAVPHTPTEDIKNIKNFNQEAIKLELVENLCRLCAKKNIYLINIFGQRGQLLDLENKLKYFPFKVNKHDTLPQGICNDCLLKVNEFFNFITDCISAEAKLRTMLKRQDCDRMCNVIKVEDNQKIVNFKSEIKTGGNQNKIIGEYTSETFLSDCYVYNQAVQENLSSFYTKNQNEANSNSETSDKNTYVFKKPSSELNTSLFYIIKENFGVNNVDFNNDTNSDQGCYNINVKDKTTPSENKILYETEDQYFNINNKYACSVCLEDFSNLDVLNSHSKIHFLQPHNNNECAYDTPHKTFLNRSSYNYEENKKVNLEKYLGFPPRGRKLNEKKKTLMFNKKPTNERSKFLKSNIISHNLKVKRKCRFCDKLFKSGDMCLVHEKIHTGETPYQCKQCGKKFRSRPSLRQHRSVHSDKRLFTCQNCKKSFKRKDTLCNHLRIHTGERPFVCKVCGFAFKQRGDCQKHQKNHDQDVEKCLISKKKQELKAVDSETILTKKENSNSDLQAQNEILWNEVKDTILPSSTIIPEVGKITVPVEDIVADQIIYFHM